MLRRPKRPPRPTWGDRPDGRPRVLLECEPEATPSIIAEVIEKEGYAVETCHGPSDHGCALLENGSCDLIDGADVVVNMLRSSNEGETILHETELLRRPPAIVAEKTSPHMGAATHDGADPPAPGPQRVTIVQRPVTKEALLGAIETALEQREAAPPVWSDGIG